jgi:pilus assembly protein Flp/PilA
MFIEKFKTASKRFIQDEEGASAIEYAIIVTMVALVVLTFVTPMGTAITAKFNAIVAALT